ncbi:MAG: hypothetical protein HN931_06235 [Desulfobacterales bacterium]|jgi:hypothetical protein|nr:hypothetical protein [Desulfobacteraceae bacterium]MBT7085754.1 hypothetical protein [Desulfobacterales bacterium]
MKEKIILIFVLVGLSMFGFRGLLPTISSSALVGIFTIAGLIGCYSHLHHSRRKRMIGELAMEKDF